MKTSEEYYRDVYGEVCHTFTDWMHFAKAYAKYCFEEWQQTGHYIP